MTRFNTSGGGDGSPDQVNPERETLFNILDVDPFMAASFEAAADDTDA